MALFWQADGSRDPETPSGSSTARTDQPVRKEQITIRLDPGMITDARLIAARKGIGHHTLLRMWVMEGITRAYQEGLLDSPPQNWTPAARRGVSDGADRADAQLPPSGARWTRPARDGTA
jgi:hypothetical protein